MATIVDLYCRMQSSPDDELVEQETLCRQLAESHGFVVGMVHRDRSTGESLGRPALTVLRSRYTTGVIQGVVIVTPDRLSRNAADLQALQEEMSRYDTALYSVREE